MNEIPKGLSEKSARYYLIMKSNLSLLKDETGTDIKNTILEDYYLALKGADKAEAIAKAKEKIDFEAETEDVIVDIAKQLIKDFDAQQRLYAIKALEDNKNI